MNCIYCAVNATSSRINSYEIEEATWISILNEFRNLGLSGVKVSGGEPFIVPKKTLSILEWCHNNNIYSDVETNATLFNDEIISSLKEFGTRLGISMDSIKKDYHNEVRGSNKAFEKTMESFNKLAKNSMQNKVIVLVSLSPANEKELFHLVEYMTDTFGIYNFKVNPIIPIGRAENQKSIPMYDVLDRLRLAELCDEISKKTNASVSIGLPPALCQTREQLKTITTACAFENLISITPNGDLTSCICGEKAFPNIYGNIVTQSLNEILTSEKYVESLKCYSSELKGICEKCLFSKYCKGGCKMEAALYGDHGLSSPSPLCQAAYEKGLFPTSRII